MIDIDVNLFVSAAGYPDVARELAQIGVGNTAELN
jgi:hypothetical protein